jgi:hypothetical protein
MEKAELPDLTLLGIEEGIVYELAIVTLSPDGSPHTAAIGCTFLRDAEGWRALSKLAKGSVTPANLLGRGDAVLNVVEEEVLVEAALDLGVVEIDFEPIAESGLFAIRGAAAAVAVKARLIDQDEVWYRFELGPYGLRVLRFDRGGVESINSGSGGVGREVERCGHKGQEQGCRDRGQLMRIAML